MPRDSEEDLDELHAMMGNAVKEHIDHLRNHAHELLQEANDVELLWSKGDWESLSEQEIVSKRVYNDWIRLMKKYGFI